MSTTPRSLFWLACVPTRLLLALLVFHGVATQIIVPILFVVGLAFLTLWATNSRLRAAEAEGQQTWWKNWRVVHGSLYVLAALALRDGNHRLAGTILFTDVGVGILASQIHYE